MGSAEDCPRAAQLGAQSRSRTRNGRDPLPPETVVAAPQPDSPLDDSAMDRRPSGGSTVASLVKQLERVRPGSVERRAAPTFGGEQLHETLGLACDPGAQDGARGPGMPGTLRLTGARSPRNAKTRTPCDLQGFREYRYGDSNPGFRRERAAS